MASFIPLPSKEHFIVKHAGMTLSRDLNPENLMVEVKLDSAAPTATIANEKFHLAPEAITKPSTLPQAHDFRLPNAPDERYDFVYASIEDIAFVERQASSNDTIAPIVSAAVADADAAEFQPGGAELENPPPTALQAVLSPTAENAAAGTVVARLPTPDAESGDSDRYEIAGGHPLFQINGHQITLKAGAQLDYETQRSYMPDIRSTEEAGNTIVKTVTVHVSDVDEFDVTPVSDSNAAANSVAENAANGTVVGVTGFASDADASNNGITYSLADNAGGRFAIDATTGVVTVADGSLLNREAAASHSISVTATSADGSTSTQSFSVNVSDVDEFDVTPVSDANAAANSVAENAANGTVVGVTDFASDADASNNGITYSLADNAGGRFAIDATTGVVTVADGSLLNREAAASHNISVTATSADGSTSTQSFSVNVSDVDEFDVGAVSDSNAAANSVAENAAVGTAVGVTGFASDADATTNTITYSLTDNAGGRFAINAATGIVTVADGSQLSYESATSHNVTAQATSSDGSVATQTFTIGVTDVAENLVLTGGNDTFADTSVTELSIDGGAGNDTITGTANADNISGGTGDDTLSGGDGNDTLAGGDGNDAIDAGAGDDSVNGGIGADIVHLGAGNDVFDGVAAADGADTIYGEDGNDTVWAGDGDDWIDGGAGDDSLKGENDNDTIYGGTGSDHVQGDAGNDILYGGGPNLIVNGSFENPDVASWGAFSSISGWTASSGSVEVMDNNNGSGTASDGQQFLEMDAGWSVDGIYQDVQTEAGQSYMLSLDIAARSGAALSTNTVQVYWNGTLVDTIDPASVAWETHTLTVVGTGGNDRLEFREPSGDNDSYGGLIDNVSLSVVDTGLNDVHGNSGDDTIYGGHGTDWMFGDTGNDTFHASLGTDLIYDSAGTDTIAFEGRAQDYEISQSLTTSGEISVTAVATAEIEGTAVFQQHEIESLQFSDRTISPASIQTGTTGVDNWTGGAGDDLYSGNNGNDVLHGANGNDIIAGGSGDDTLYGDAGNDGLHGGAGNDIIYGGTGDDTLAGGTGNDTLYGEDGSDLFLFASNGGLDSANGGAGASWIDTIELTGVNGGSPGVYGTDWTMNLTSGSIVSQDAHHITLSQDADGHIVFNGGNDLTFTDMERIEF